MMILIKMNIGIMKDEYGGVIVIEFIGSKAKMYAIKKNRWW